MIYFKDPRIKFHREAWGAVVRTPQGQVLLDSDQLALYDSFTELKLSTESSLPEELESLRDLGLILCVSEEDVA
jgi:hypothetical protein